MKKTIMIQGTASGVGKSTIALGLCRLFRQAGFRVAPFKVLNCSHAAHTLPDGGQMARSQALQAMACGIAPCADQNPVLVKPSGNSELIIGGSPVGFALDFEPAHLRQIMAQAADAAYCRLQSNYDILVAEGAGSPVELNLKEDEFVNMGFAKRYGADVILVADVNRGGVFASVYGTMQLLAPAERELVKGIVINQFCGDPAQFSDAIPILEKLAQKPVLGVVPKMELAVEDEDMTFDKGPVKTRQSLSAGMDEEQYQQHLDREFNKLAGVLRRCLDLRALDLRAVSTAYD